MWWPLFRLCSNNTLIDQRWLTLTFENLQIIVKNVKIKWCTSAWYIRRNLHPDFALSVFQSLRITFSNRFSILAQRYSIGEDSVHPHQSVQFHQLYTAISPAFSTGYNKRSIGSFIGNYSPVTRERDYISLQYNTIKSSISLKFHSPVASQRSESAQCTEENCWLAIQWQIWLRQLSWYAY